MFAAVPSARCRASSGRSARSSGCWCCPIICWSSRMPSNPGLKLFPAGTLGRGRTAPRDGRTLKVGARLNGQPLLERDDGVTASLGLWLARSAVLLRARFHRWRGRVRPSHRSDRCGPFQPCWSVERLAADRAVRDRLLLRSAVPSRTTFWSRRSATAGLASCLVGDRRAVHRQRALLGVAGAILAVPTAILQVVVQEYLDREDRYSVEIKS